MFGVKWIVLVYVGMEEDNGFFVEDFIVVVKSGCVCFIIGFEFGS